MRASPTTSRELYTNTFYQEQKVGSLRSAQRIVPHIMELFPHIKSVIDFGCGSGAWLSVFQTFGVDAVTGLDYGIGVEKNLLIPAQSYHETDLSRPIKLERRHDLAMSLEVAEHLPPEASDTFVDSLTSAADIVLFSAAIPFQTGEGHFTLHWPSFWRKKFSQRDFTCFDILRPRFWCMSDIECWYRQNMLLFLHKEIVHQYSVLKEYPSYHAFPLWHFECLEGQQDSPSFANVVFTSYANRIKARYNPHVSQKSMIRKGYRAIRSLLKRIAGVAR